MPSQQLLQAEKAGAQYTSEKVTLFCVNIILVLVRYWANHKRAFCVFVRSAFCATVEVIAGEIQPDDPEEDTRISAFLKHKAVQQFLRTRLHTHPVTPAYYRNPTFGMDVKERKDKVCLYLIFVRRLDGCDIHSISFKLEPSC